MKRARILGLASAVVVVVGIPAAVVGFSSGGAPSGSADGAGTADGEATVTATAVVTRRDLEEREELDGTLGYPSAHEVALGAGGTITGLAPEGSVVERGGSLGEVDGEPVVLLQGGRPMWRTIGEGADTTAGADIEQLEQNLIDLGHGTAAALGPNETWSQATTAAVKRWQATLGVEETGVVDRGAVVFAPGAVRVGEHLAAVGSPAGGPTLSLTGLDRVVAVDLDASRQDLLEVGQEVDVQLPDGVLAPGVVYSIASVVDPGDPNQGTAPTVEVIIALTDPAAAAGLDQAPVDVQIVSVQAADALTVPVDALLALAEGGYAVERPDGDLVGVDIGAFADGFVEVTPTGASSLDEGDEVVVPS